MIGYLIVIIIYLLTANDAIAINSAPIYTTSIPVTGMVQLPSGFPRLGMWWPDLWTQSLDDIARYDWVALWPGTEQFIPDLRARNPDILLLNATNACELSYYPGSNLEPWEIAQNEEVIKIPAAWFLTQVGSELTQAVDANETLFHVTAVTATDGAETYALFVEGDTALIESESVYIEAVDAVNKTLTVQRGYVRPAGTHAAGTRIAAHVTFWPDSWVLNVSTLSPQAIISPTIGPEIWPDYNARRAIALVNAGTASPGESWDGILLDRSDADESWLIGNSTARTLDPDQSNTLLTNYDDFDAAWNAGLRHYEQVIREAIGVGKIIFVNWGMANYEVLNGNNFEGFPMEDGTAYGVSWKQTVFGPVDGGSYFEWMAQAQSPNLTMIETYEDDSGPDPTDDGSYDNPCDDPGFVPNYRKLRFGLTTALLNDGFFSYEINTNGHGALCLLWFDEYDGAGLGRGYLGQPLGPARQALPALTTSNLLGDGTFEQGLGEWDLWAAESYTATFTTDASTAAEGNASVRVDVTQSQGTDWEVEFSKSPVNIISGTEYTLSFWAKANGAWTIAAAVQQNTSPWNEYLGFESIALSTTWQMYEFSGVAAGSDPAAVFHLEVGATTGSVWFDDVRLQTGGRDVWRRDYTGGVALSNATASVQTVPLGGTYHKLRGTQVPDVNNGHIVTQVVLPPLDGIIVLRMGHQMYLPVILKLSHL
ncbi:MAG: carbohydrate binding domain-containing protein [Anaerolineae bacterium]|nr:carbohydrate binding domain-containing protein [Anaerolineae bacterium]